MKCLIRTKNINEIEIRSLLPSSASVLSLLVSLTARPPLNSAAGAAEESARLSVLGNTLIASRRAVSGSLIVQDGGAVPSLDFFLWSERMFVSYETKTM